MAKQRRAVVESPIATAQAVLDQTFALVVELQTQSLDAARWSDAQIGRWREERRDMNLLHQALEAPKSALHKAPAAELTALLDSGGRAQAAVVAAKGPKSMDRALRELANHSSELDHYT